ncbi:type II toxin-antitoxin system PemK/MazF family toxin [Streptomyces sp. NBC_00249]|uniref:type II toxin-antitoxin system PemK/MazF family toxin n=1 Tax=Streptomyces sp. NBC_00249 TaxID=2975690 RepID=UPI0022544013|nr:type II toxin-antitoxin system PemK/MazF family toxin [Streptomyces sp. NBC_00249]MCX5193259.1 type II toxin-antitoxin system PemK/MazF family toxin [Streptomyces sp. NBC_00249]
MAGRGAGYGGGRRHERRGNARRGNRSCAGLGCLGYLLLNALLITGMLLAAPVVLPDLMAGQTPPVRVEGAGQWAVLYGIPVVAALGVAAVAGRRQRFVLWLLLVRAAALLAAVAVVVPWTRSAVAGDGAGNVRLFAGSGTAAVVVLAAYGAIRWWDDRRGARPRAGEIWLAMVPLREDPSQELRHYCVVLATRPGHAEVAQITSKDKDGRRDHLRIPNDGWDEVSGRSHWVEAGREPRAVRYRSFLRPRPQGRCPREVWAQLQERRPGS